MTDHDAEGWDAVALADERYRKFLAGELHPRIKEEFIKIRSPCPHRYSYGLGCQECAVGS